MAVPARHVRTSGPARRPASVRRAPTARPAPRARRAPFVLVFLVVVGAMVMALVSMQALVAQRSFRVQDLERQAEELSSEYERLRLRLAEASMPGRIQAAADRAGLVPHERLEILEVPRSPGGRVLASDRDPGAVKAALGAGG